MSPSSVHLLFLFSLGVFSWAIICYFKEIEKRLMCSPVNNSPDQSSDSNEVAAQELVRDQFQPNRCRDNYELYVNFLCVVACIYALAKVAHIAERYLARQMYGKFNVYNTSTFDIQTGPSTTEDYVKNSEEMLRLQIDKLTRQNLELKFGLCQSEHDRAEQTAEVTSPPSDRLLQNIYISNRNVCLNHKVYMNGDARMRKFNFPEKINEINDVWQNYLEMRESYVPVVLSMEDLQQKYNGLI